MKFSIMYFFVLFLPFNLVFSQEVDPLDGVKLHPEYSEALEGESGELLFSTFQNIQINNTDQKRQVETTIEVNQINSDNLVSAWKRSLLLSN